MAHRDMDRDMEFNSNQKAVTRKGDRVKTKQTITYYKWEYGKWVPTSKRDIVTEDGVPTPAIGWQETNPPKMDKQEDTSTPPREWGGTDFAYSPDSIVNWVEEFVRCQ